MRSNISPLEQPAKRNHISASWTKTKLSKTWNRKIKNLACPEDLQKREAERRCRVFKLTTQAYCKMMLHGAKHPACAVNGVLVAERQKRKEAPQQQVLFVDCIPLFHGTIALSPVLEVALTLIDTWCKENSYVIAGYYQGNERLKDNSLNLVAERIASRIAEGCSDAALIMVDNSKFSVDCILPSIHVYENHDSRWKARDPHE
ncbi:unnamed protein product [Ranitomeya imitator]|uniref:MPN domain-containing protein n=1 Tax=Ranitomeya imitator TaxID=111125 RepID=A0ABN9MNA0_9NEOB|nr:unnamed protein product [Ranitomeya imitator]